MTEDEAKKKVCKQLVIYDEQGIFRETNYIYCIASDCMMWRVITDSKNQLTGEGYCGLGGDL